MKRLYIRIFFRGRAIWVNSCAIFLSWRYCLTLWARNWLPLSLRMMIPSALIPCKIQSRSKTTSCFLILYLSVCPKANRVHTSSTVNKYTNLFWKNRCSWSALAGIPWPLHSIVKCMTTSYLVYWIVSEGWSEHPIFAHYIINIFIESYKYICITLYLWTQGDWIRTKSCLICRRSTH